MLGATGPTSIGGVCFTLNRSPPKSSSLSLDSLHAGATTGRSSKYRKFFSKTKKKSVQDLPSWRGEGSSSSNKGGLFQFERSTPSFQPPPTPPYIRTSRTRAQTPGSEALKSPILVRSPSASSTHERLPDTTGMDTVDFNIPGTEPLLDPAFIRTGARKRAVVAEENVARNKRAKKQRSIIALMAEVPSNPEHAKAPSSRPARSLLADSINPARNRRVVEASAADGTIPSPTMFSTAAFSPRRRWFPHLHDDLQSQERQRALQRRLRKSASGTSNIPPPGENHPCLGAAPPFDPKLIEEAERSHSVPSITHQAPAFARGMTGQQLSCVVAPLMKPLCINAGPGSGKTRTLISRMCYCTEYCRVDPRSILAFTFTKAATQEIKDRCQDVCGERVASQMNIQNFHAFCLQILMRHCGQYDVLGRGRSDLAVLSAQQEQYEYVATAIARVRESERYRTGNPVLDLIPPAVAKDCAKHDVADQSLDLEIAAAVEHKVWNSSNGTCRGGSSAPKKRVGFDYPIYGPGAPDPDCVTHFVKFVRQAKARCQYPYHFFDKQGAAVATHHVDVYAAYEELLDLNHKLDFGDFVPGVLYLFEKAPALLTHYRDLYRFVFVDEFQDLNRPQLVLLQTLCPAGRITVCGDADQSIYGFRGACGTGAFDELKRFYPHHNHHRLNKNHRSTKVIVTTAETLIGANYEQGLAPQLTHSVVNGDGADVLQWCNQTPRSEAERIAAYIKRRHKEENTPYRSFAVVARTLYVVRDLESVLLRNKIPIDGIYNHTRAPPASEPVDAVTVTSIHRAKGKEWPTVIVARMNEGVFPIDRRPREHHAAVTGLLENEAENEDLLREERRLAYVAATRAAKQLIFSFVTFDGESHLHPSRFIEEAVGK